MTGTNSDGEVSHYVYGGLGYRIANEYVIDRNNNGYAGISAAPANPITTMLD